MNGKDFARVCKASKAVTTSQRSYMPILNNVKITENEYNISLESTNLDSYLKCTVYTEKNEGENSVFIDGKYLSESTKGLKGNIDLVIDGNRLCLGNFALLERDIEKDDWPMFPEVDQGEQIYTWTGKSFKAMIKRASITALKDTETTRLSFTGLCCQWNADNRRFMSCDGCRLLVDTPGNPENFEAKGEILLPIKELKRIASIAKTKDTVTMYICNSVSEEKNVIGAKWAKIEIISDGCLFTYTINPIPEEFPDVARVIPHKSDAKTTFEIDSNSFSKCLSEAVKVSMEDRLDVVLSLDVNDFIIEASSDEGSYKQKLPISNVKDGYEFKPSRFQGKWLSGFAGFCKDNITIRWQEDIKAIRLDGKTDEGTYVTYVQMPLRRDI
jgi:DNA polymerase III sliding clamp (beta) subunit (PCNA family)